MPVLSYQVNAPGYGGINPKLIYIFTDNTVAEVTTTGYIDWLANQQGIYTGDVALVVTRETSTSTFGANFYEFQRVGMGPHWNLVPEASSNVNSVSGTLNEIIASPTTGNVVVSIYPNPVLPGNAAVTLPKGNTVQRAGAAGSIRFNTQLTQFEVTLDGTNWVALTTGGGGAVTSVTGTTNQIIASPTTGNVIVSIDPDPIIPGNAEITLPAGTTGQRGTHAGSLRFNNQLNEVELTNDGVNWYPVSNGSDTVNSVSGTANRITVTGTNNVVVDIAPTYVGQTSIDTLGTVTTGTWNANTIDVTHGGTSGTSFTKNAPICGGTTSTSVFQSADTGITNVGYVLTSRGDSLTPSFQALPTPGNVLAVTITLSQSQLQSMYATPIQIIAAQGANSVIFVQEMLTEYFYAGSPTFSGGPEVVIQYGNTNHGGGTVIQVITGGAQLGLPRSIMATYSPTFLYNTSGAQVLSAINAGVYISNQTAAFTSGNAGSQLRVTIYYSVISTLN